MDYYTILGINRNASSDEIRSAYRKLALRWHPDRWTKNPSRIGEATCRFQKILEAYSVLYDEVNKSSYDAQFHDRGKVPETNVYKDYEVPQTKGYDSYKDYKVPETNVYDSDNDYKDWLGHIPSPDRMGRVVNRLEEAFHTLKNGWKWIFNGEESGKEYRDYTVEKVMKEIVLKMDDSLTNMVVENRYVEEFDKMESKMVELESNELVKGDPEWERLRGIELELLIALDKKEKLVRKRMNTINMLRRKLKKVRSKMKQEKRGEVKISKKERERMKNKMVQVVLRMEDYRLKIEKRRNEIRRMLDVMSEILVYFKANYEKNT